jgi:hypothetical protein
VALRLNLKKSGQRQLTNRGKMTMDILKKLTSLLGPNRTWKTLCWNNLTSSNSSEFLSLMRSLLMLTSSPLRKRHDSFVRHCFGCYATFRSSWFSLYLFNQLIVLLRITLTVFSVTKFRIASAATTQPTFLNTPWLISLTSILLSR